MKADTLLFLCLFSASLAFAGGVMLAPEATIAEVQIQEQPPKAAEETNSVVADTPSGTGSVLEGAPRMGEANAAVVLLVVSDFQCPVCRRAAEPMEEIVENFKGDLVVYFIQNPLKMHKNAMVAAQASMAAHKQGQFWAYHDLLFANQGRLSSGHLTQHAQQMNLDMNQFAVDREDLQIKEQIKRQATAVSDLGARGTPSFFINGKKTVGWGSQIGIEGQIKKEVEATKALMSEGKTLSEAYKTRVEANSENSELYLTNFGR